MNQNDKNSMMAKLKNVMDQRRAVMEDESEDEDDEEDDWSD